MIRKFRRFRRWEEQAVRPAANPRSSAKSADAFLRPRGGFTLLELVLVMLLLTAMCALAVPSLRGFLGGSRSRDAVSQVVSLAQYAKAMATAEARVYRLNVDGASYWLNVQQGEGFVETGTDFGQRFEMPPGMSIQVMPTSGITNLRGDGLPADERQLDPGGIEFLPNGRTGRGLFKLTDADGAVTLIGSPSPSEAFRVLSEIEAARI
jgi:type II secretory pathway pseudopilin PulG